MKSTKRQTTAAFVVMLFSLLGPGCNVAGEPGRPEKRVRDRERKEGAIQAARTPAVGDPCTSSDGWQRPNMAAGPSTFTQPTVVPVPAGTIDVHQLPAGVGYCLRPGGIYPNGYFTMSCDSDRDCPSRSRCDERQCRRECSSDVECAAPSRCRGNAPRFCFADSPSRSGKTP